MRKQLVKTVTEVMQRDKRVVLFLGDIGVYGFREAFEQFPNRVYNIGILEQASVSVAAGLALEGMIPVFHTIAPFLVERALEQLKVDFGYQGLGGNFISVGGSYDYASLGCTHHCPGDVQALKTIPNMEIVVPGHPLEFDEAFKSLYANGKPTYFRLSEHSNESPRWHWPVKVGSQGNVIAVGPMLDRVVQACQNLDVSIYYYNGTGRNPIGPVSCDEQGNTRGVVIVEPFYEGTMLYDVEKHLSCRATNMYSMGVPRKFLTNYGSTAEHDKDCWLTIDLLRLRIRSALGL